MLYVVTVHFRTSKWLDIQRSYLQRHVHEPFKVYASLEGISKDYWDRFDRVSDAIGNHEGKLNLLASEIAAEARRDDILLFLDGDAFPIADPMPTIHQALQTTSLVAIRRDENRGDVQPHPSFCAVTVGEWERLHGDWSSGFVWKDSTGHMTTDVGGNLLGALERTGSRWTPLLRSNTHNVHPLWFGVYGDIAYHHGAGFRKPMARVDYDARPGSLRGASLPIVGRGVAGVNARRRRRWEQETHRHAEMLGEQWFRLLSEDPEFHLLLSDPAQRHV